MTTRKLIFRALTSTTLLAWFDKGFWQYLLEKDNGRGYCSKWHRFWCRAAGHPNGPWYYNMGGYEPDWTCKNCGDKLD